MGPSIPPSAALVSPLIARPLGDARKAPGKRSQPTSARFPAVLRLRAHRSVSGSFDRDQNTARRDRGFVDLGTDTGESVADGISDSSWWGYRSTFSHSFHAVFGVRGGGMEMPDLDRRHFDRTRQQIIGQSAG